MRVKDYIIEVLWEIIYLIIMIVYLIQLNALNHELHSRDFSGAFELLQYKNHAPLTYFGVAAGLFLVGCFLVLRGVHRVLREMDSYEERVVSCLATLIIIFLLILLFIFIDNPILRAVFVAGLAVLGLANAG